MNGWRAFRIGLSRATRTRWVLVILFAANLVSALPLVVLPGLGLVAFGHRPAIRQAADGVDAWLVIETMLAPLSGAALGGEGADKLHPWPELTRQLQQATLVGLATAAALPVLAWLTGAFLSGGLVLTFAEVPQDAPGTGAGSRRFQWRRFLWGCWHWFGAFLLLGAVQGIASSVVFGPLVAAAMGAVAVVGGWSAWVVVPVLVAVGVLWLALMEYTRIVAVVGETRNVVRAFGEAARFVVRNLRAVAGLYGLALVLLGVVHAIYRLGLMPWLPLDWWVLVLVVQQGFVLGRLWARVVRVAGGVALYGSMGRGARG
jgi:hypothetical protein